MSDKTCGHCRWFDGDGWLDEGGTGSGECCYDPPIWVGPSPDGMHEDAWVEHLFNCWQRPMVGVASKPCHHFDRPYEKRWWELKGKRETRKESR